MSLHFPGGFKSSQQNHRELGEHQFRLFPVDHECKEPCGIRILRGDGRHRGCWLERCPFLGVWFDWGPSFWSLGEIPQEFLAVIRSLAAGDQVRCLLVQLGRRM